MKRVFALVLSAVLLLSVLCVGAWTVSADASAEGYVPGDANMDGKVNVRDLGAVQQYLNGWTVALDKLAADVNGDGKVNVRDVGVMQQYLNGWSVTLVPGGSAVDPNLAAREQAILAEPDTISFITIGYDGKNQDSPYYKAIQELQNTYGKTVEIVMATGDQSWDRKVADQVAIGDPIDVFYINDDHFLSMYLKGYMAPVDEYVDLTRPWHNRLVMDEYMQFDGQHYAAGVTATPYVLYYNRDLLIQGGYAADYPMELYRNGQWTWETFAEVAYVCQEASDDDRMTGLQNMYDEVWQGSNACSVVDFVDGRYVLNIDGDATRQTLEMVQDIFCRNCICGQGYDKGQNQFLLGRAVFHGAYAYEDKVFKDLLQKGTIDLDIGVVPFPVGPNNTEGVNYGDAGGFCIAAGTDAPYTSGMLIDLIRKYQQEEEPTAADLLDPANEALYDALAENLYFPAYTDGILEQGFGAFYLLYYVRRGNDINSMIALYREYYQKMIDDAIPLFPNYG